MATLQQTRTAVDDWLAARWPTVVARQDTYASNHAGRYFQGVRWVSLAATPSDGGTVAPTLSVKPTDQQETWSDLNLGALGSVPCSLQIDVYQGPGGWGWVATVEVLFNGTRYSRSRNVGAEDWRTQAWHVVTQGT